MIKKQYMNHENKAVMLLKRSARKFCTFSILIHPKLICFRSGYDIFGIIYDFQYLIFDITKTIRNNIMDIFYIELSQVDMDSFKLWCFLFQRGEREREREREERERERQRDTDEISINAPMNECNMS
jgi:hypothetical protein